jgi:hypothetical protein
MNMGSHTAWFPSAQDHRRPGVRSISSSQRRALGDSWVQFFGWTSSFTGPDVRSEPSSLRGISLVCPSLVKNRRRQQVSLAISQLVCNLDATHAGHKTNTQRRGPKARFLRPAEGPYSTCGPVFSDRCTVVVSTCLLSAPRSGSSIRFGSISCSTVLRTALPYISASLQCCPTEATARSTTSHPAPSPARSTGRLSDLLTRSLLPATQEAPISQPRAP